MIIGGKSFETTGHTYVMGILNVTPDSFPTAASILTPKKRCATR